MALEASDRLIDIIWVPLCWHHGKIKRNQPIPPIVDLHKSGSPLGAISNILKVPRSSAQTIVRKYKYHGTTQQSYPSGRRHALSPRNECTLVRKVQINPRTTAKDLVKPKNTIPTVKHGGWQHHVVGVLCCRTDWCTSQKMAAWGRKIMWIYRSNISRYQSGS